MKIFDATAWVLERVFFSATVAALLLCAFYPDEMRALLT